MFAGGASATYKVYDARGVEMINVVGTSFAALGGPIIAGLPVGTYYVTKDGLPNGVSCSDCPPTAGIPIVVGPTGNVSSLSFTVPPRRISGTITNVAGGAPLSTITQVLSAIRGTGPYAFDVTTGALPAGVTLNATTGVLAGTPTVAGRSMFRVSALDSTGCATDRTYVLDIQACAFALTPSSATVPASGGTVAITIADACGSQDVVEGIQWIAVQSNTPGQVTLAVELNPFTAPRTASVAIGRRSFEIRQAGLGSEAPFGALDLPLDLAQVRGAIAISKRRPHPARRWAATPASYQRRWHGCLTLASMERIELSLGASDQTCPATWAGYLVKDGVLSELPVGAFAGSCWHVLLADGSRLRR